MSLEQVSLVSADQSSITDLNIRFSKEKAMNVQIESLNCNLQQNYKII